MKSLSIGVSPDALFLLTFLIRSSMSSGLEDMDEEAEGEQGTVDISTTTTPDTTLNTESTEHSSHDISHALPLHRTDSPESVRHSVNPSRNSYDPHGSDDSHARLIDVRRGAAPAYETIDLDVAEEPAPAPLRRNSQSARISGFFSRFMPQRGNNGNANELAPLSPPPDTQNPTFSPSHSRELSAQSGASGVVSADSHGSPQRSRVDRTHRNRNNNLSTGSVFTVLSRTISRNHDDVPLTSPSMISLSSISPPLTHTATRTEFAYPRTGPTSEQIKFISSKDTFGRFGLPYGPDAIAFAASSSRQNLPPDFDSIHRPSFGDLSPNPDDGSASNLRRSTSAGRLSSGDQSDREGPPFPESADPSPDVSLTDPPTQLSLSEQDSSPSLGADILTSPSQNSLSKQKSTPTLGMGHSPLSKSTPKPRSLANLRGDGERSFSPRSTSAAGSYMTMESFQTAHDDGDGSLPSSPTVALGLVPQIMVQLPSNNPSLTNLAEGGSGSETDEFFDGDEDMEGSESDDEEGEGVNGGGTKTPKPASVSESGDLGEVEDDEPSSLSDEEDSDSSESNPKGPQDAHIRASNSLSSGSSSGSDDESEVETRSNHTEVDKTVMTADTGTGRMGHIHEGTDMTLTPEMVAATLNASSSDLTKANGEISRTTVIGV
jgi:hypothetical protein